MHGDKTSKGIHSPGADNSSKEHRGQQQDHTQVVPSQWLHNGCSDALITAHNGRAPEGAILSGHG